MQAPGTGGNGSSRGAHTALLIPPCMTWVMGSSDGRKLNHCTKSEKIKIWRGKALKQPEFSKSWITFVGENCQLTPLLCPGVGDFCVQGHLSLPAGVWEAGRRQVRRAAQAGEEHRSPGSRCSTRISRTGKALLAGAGTGRGEVTVGWEQTPCPPFMDPSVWHPNSTGREERGQGG